MFRDICIAVRKKWVGKKCYKERSNKRLCPQQEMEMRARFILVGLMKHTVGQNVLFCIQVIENA